MAKQTRGPQQPGSKSVVAEYRAPILALLAVLVFIGGIFAYIDEGERPGYSTVSQVFRSAEVVAMSRKAAEDRRAAEEKRGAERKEAAKKYAEEQAVLEKENSFIRSGMSFRRKVICPDPTKWVALGSEYQQRWHEILGSRHMPRIGDNCYLE